MDKVNATEAATTAPHRPCTAWPGHHRLAAAARILAIVYAPLLIVPYLFAIGSQPGYRVSVDFMSFWSAASLAWRDPASAYDAASQIAFQASAFQTRGGYLPFLYPPPFLALVAPLGLLPFALAYPAWVAATYGIYFASTRRLLAKAAWPIAVFPAVYINAVQGQTAALFTGIFLAAALQVERRPWVAGLLFGALVFKPQLALLVPLALIAGGKWRTFLAAALSASGLLLAALILLGTDTYRAFLDNSAVSLSLLQGGSVGWGKIQSLLGALNQIGAPPGLAAGAQGVLAIAAGAFVVAVWRTKADTLTKTAALAMGALLATPYMLDYDLVLLIAPICWLARRATEVGLRRWETCLLAAVYLGPLFCRQVAVAAGFNLMSPLLIGFAGLLAVKMLRRGPEILSSGSSSCPRASDRQREV